MLMFVLGKLVKPECLVKWYDEILSEIKIKLQIWLSLEAFRGPYYKHVFVISCKFLKSYSRRDTACRLKGFESTRNFEVQCTLFDIRDEHLR
jgi:hypothetical protein